MLIGLKPLNAGTYTAVSVLFAAVAAIAAYVPPPARPRSIRSLRCATSDQTSSAL
jgi:hypothetical protein